MKDMLSLLIDRALKFYDKSAKQGNSESYLKVGDMYYYGRGGVIQNKAGAAALYQVD
jgi:TPR repeat protein